MTLTELEAAAPALKEYTKNMPEDIRSRCTVRTHAAGSIIHQKNMELGYFGIVAKGENRVINEFENGNVFMIERNEPIDFIGEVTILAGKPRTSVTIETTTESTIIYISRKDFEDWIAKDIYFLRLVSAKVAFKLYRSSYNRGARLFYPPHYLLLHYLLQYADRHRILEKGQITLPLTRQELFEEIGVTVKTINRTVTRLKSDGLLGVSKGKLTLTLEQYEKAAAYVKNYATIFEK